MSYLSVILADTPAGFWRLDEAAGTNAADSSGNALAGTHTGAVTLNQIGAIGDGNAAASYASGERTAMGDPAGLKPAALTVECWVKFTVIGAIQHLVGRTASGYILGINAGGTPFFQVFNAAAVSATSTGSAVKNDGFYHHLVGTYDGANVRLYVDNVLQASAPALAGTVHYAAAGVFSIGATDTGTLPTTGAIDDVAIYATALSAEKVTEHWNAHWNIVPIGMPFVFDVGLALTLIPAGMPYVIDGNYSSTVQVANPILNLQAHITVVEPGVPGGEHGYLTYATGEFPVGITVMQRLSSTVKVSAVGRMVTVTVDVADPNWPNVGVYDNGVWLADVALIGNTVTFDYMDLAFYHGAPNTLSVHYGPPYPVTEADSLNLATPTRFDPTRISYQSRFAVSLVLTTDNGRIFATYVTDGPTDATDGMLVELFLDAISFGTAPLVGGVATWEVPDDTYSAEAFLPGTFVYLPGQSVVTALEVTSPEVEFGAGEVAGNLIGLTWAEFALEKTDLTTTVYVWAKVDLADPADYYYGFKEARILSYDSIVRAMSDDQGNYESSTFSMTLSDTDRLLRGLLAGPTTKFFLNRQMAWRMISDEDRRARRTPRLMARGVVRNYEAESDLQFKIDCEDFASSKVASHNNKQQIPQRVLPAADFPNCPGEPARTPIGKPIPIIYGEVSDMDVPVGGGLTKPVVTAVVVGVGGAETYRYAVTALDNSGNQAFNYDERANHKGETNYDVVTIGGCPHTDDMSPSNYVKLTWPGVTGAHHYRVYGRYMDGDLSLMDQADWNAVDGDHYHDGERNGNVEVDILKTDSHPPTVNNTLQPDKGTGVVPVRYVGTRVVGATGLWHEFLVCGHAVKEIIGWYRAGVRVDPSEEGVNYLIPGFAGWTAAHGAATKYVVYNGNRYTTIFARGEAGDKAADGSEPITLNVKGIEAIGDGTGTLIEDVAMQYYHFLVNWGFGNYLNGAWLTPPTWAPLDATLDMIDAASFTAASTLAGTYIAGGYKGGGVIGVEDTQLALAEVMSWFNLAAGVRSGFSRNQQFFVRGFDPNYDLAMARHYTQINHIKAGSFEAKPDVSKLFTQVLYSHTHHWAKGHWTVEDAELHDDPAETNYKERQTAPTVELHFIRSAAIANDIMQRRLNRSKRVPIIGALTTNMGGLNTELGDIILITHKEGIGVDGWVEKPVWVLRHITDPDAFTVTFEFEDVEDLLT